MQARTFFTAVNNELRLTWLSAPHMVPYLYKTDLKSKKNSEVKEN
jgi:hypothetical protein